MTILFYDLVGEDPSRPFSPHCWKTRMALAHKRLDYSRRPTRFLELSQVEGGRSKLLPILRDGETVVSDSFSIALYLEEKYGNQPTLFAGEGGMVTARFIEAWAEATLYPYINTVTAVDLLSLQAGKNAEYFRASREQIMAQRLEDVVQSRESNLMAFRAALQPLRTVLTNQHYLGGTQPLYVDYIIFGAFQLARIASDYQMLGDDDPVAKWFDRCLDLFDGLGRTVDAASDRTRLSTP